MINKIDTSTICVTFTLHVDGGDDAGGKLGNKAVKPVTTVQYCVSAFVSMTPLGRFKET